MWSGFISGYRSDNLSSDAKKVLSPTHFLPLQPRFTIPKVYVLKGENYVEEIATKPMRGFPLYFAERALRSKSKIGYEKQRDAYINSWRKMTQEQKSSYMTLRSIRQPCNEISNENENIGGIAKEQEGLVGFLLFFDENKDLFSKQNPSYDDEELRDFCLDIWKSMTREERIPYSNRVPKDKQLGADNIAEADPISKTGISMPSNEAEPQTKNIPSDPECSTESECGEFSEIFNRFNEKDSSFHTFDANVEDDEKTTGTDSETNNDQSDQKDDASEKVEEEKIENKRPFVKGIEDPAFRKYSKEHSWMFLPFPVILGYMMKAETTDLPTEIPDGFKLGTFEINIRTVLKLI